MKYSLTRLAVALTALYWIGGIVFAIASAALEPKARMRANCGFGISGIIRWSESTGALPSS
jgi:hypothetical protein